jgi:hypothetical protein
MTEQHKPPIQLNMGKARVALGEPDTPALVLLTIAMWAFGDAVLGDPETGVEPMDPSELWAGLNEIFGTWVSEEGENKLNAMTLALQGDLFYRDVEVFQAVATALFDGDLGDLLTIGFEDLTATEIMWAVLEVELAREDEDGPPEFSSGVMDYIARALALEQEDQEANSVEVKQAYLAMLDQLRDIGVPLSALRLWDEEYAETIEFLDAADAIAPVPVA